MIFRLSIALLCLVSTSFAAGEAELIAVLGARARAALKRHDKMIDAPPSGNGLKSVPDEMAPIPTKESPKQIRIPVASLNDLPAIGISYGGGEVPMSVSSPVTHPKIKVTGYVMPNADFNPSKPVGPGNQREGRCDPCKRTKTDIKTGNSRIEVTWLIGPPPADIPEIYPVLVWSDATNRPRFLNGYHSMAALQSVVFAPQNNPVAELPSGVDSVAYGARPSGNMGNIGAQEHVALGLSWIEQYIGQGNVMTFEWDRSSDTNRFDLLHAKGQWTAPAIFGRSGRIRIAVKGSTKLPTDQLAFTYRLEGHDLVVDAEPITFPGLADSLGIDKDGASGNPAMGAAYGFDPMTIWTIFSVLRMVWQACHPSCDLELPSHIQCDAVLVGQQLRIRFTNMPKIRFVWFWTFMLGIKTVAIDTSTLHIDFVGSRFVNWREFSIVPSGTSSGPAEELPALPLEVYEPPPKPPAKVAPKPAKATAKLPSDWHSHQCDHRGTSQSRKPPTTWSHSSSGAARDPNAHRCPTCGREQYEVL